MSRPKLAIAAALLTLSSCDATGEVNLGSRCPKNSPGCNVASGGSTSSGDASPGGAKGAADAGIVTAGPDDVWVPLSVMAIVNPVDHGAKGDGTTDDLGALGASVDALPDAGGIVYLPSGAVFRKTNLLVITRSHVKFWAPEGQATLLQSIAGQRRHQSMLCQKNEGCGFFGVKFESDATARFDALEDNQITVDHGTLVEVVGCDIAGSAAAGVFLYGSTEQYIEGNYVHHTWADHIHHTDGARQSWVWGNYVFNENPSKGDNGVACVTYGHSSPRCGDMEWWKNTILHTEGGRGYAVIGGDDISLHDNWAIGVHAAGIAVASEQSYDSASSSHIAITRNAITRCGAGTAHPGILISGLNPAAEPITDVTLTDNVSANNADGALRQEGAFTNVTDTGLRDAAASLPTPEPTGDDVHLADTSILRTRDVSHVDAAFRSGLYRIHVRRAPSGSTFEERFEYVVKGPAPAMTAFVDAHTQAGDHLSERRELSGFSYVLLLASAPIAIPSALSAVSFRDLRAGDLDGSLSWLWERIDSGTY